MSTARVSRIVAVLGTAIVTYGQPRQSKGAEAWNDYPYSAAFLSSNGGFPPHMEVVVFPFIGKAFKIPIWPARALTFSPDGKALYGVCKPYPDEPTTTSLCKIDLTTTGTTFVKGSIGLNASDLAVSDRGDHILVSDRRGMEVVLFELRFPGGGMRLLFSESDRSPRTFWAHLSLSQDGKRAVATHNGRVELIDVTSGAAKPLGDQFFIAAWSPDGKWLAALEKGEHGRTILFDATTMTRRRVLGNSEMDWSPDSRYLLGTKEHDRCGPYSSTLQTINIDTGERTTITSSECQVNKATTGWVSRDVLAR